MLDTALQIICVHKITYILVKLHKKLLPPELPFMTQIRTKSFVGWGFAADPLGELTALPDTPNCI